MTDDFEFQIESRLTSHGVYVDQVTETEAGFEITYESVTVDSEEVIPHREVGRVINVFRDLHDDDWEGADISAVVTDFDGNEYGEWMVEQEWFDSLHNGDLTETEFSQKVIETIEYVEE
ncbi:hypothetical protein [Halobacteriaceae bacterium SHR40]|uniref:hypothetical protein n=1 Tax=Halovenus amylolytica TaxID=2500550 RepID=UPI000FE2EB2F